MLTRPTNLIQISAATALMLIGGCDEQVAEVAREAADRQAQQNNQMAELQQEVASGSRQLVASDAEARREVLGVHRDLQSERTRLDSGWHDLETQRQRIAGQRRSDSALVAVTKLAGGLAVVIVLVGFCWFALVSLRADGAAADAEFHELLIREITGESSQLLSTDTLPPSRLASPSGPPALGEPPAVSPPEP